MAQQLFVILPDRLRQHAFHVMTDGDGQGEALRIEGAGRARDVNHAKQFAIGWIVNRQLSRTYSDGARFTQGTSRRNAFQF